MQNQQSLSRRRLLQLAGMVAGSGTLSACTITITPTGMPMTTIPAPEMDVANPDEALERLLVGNQRFAANMTKDPNHSSERRMMVAGGQHPFATIFSCVDSRVPPEIVFDRGLGDLFVIRTAGHVIDNAVLGSLEFGVGELHIPLLMVLGHEKCGAVKATIEAVEKQMSAPAQIGTLVEAITPAVEVAQGQSGDLLDNAVRANTMLVVDQLIQTPILADAVTNGQLRIVGGRYDLDTGEVEMFTA
ncbi:MAG: carbonic anhydrase [Caldilinea sp. CFX5]|nr:carbonic anhydrase [Caldilinea sp. CFX5]